MSDNPYTRSLEIPAELLETEPTAKELQALACAEQMGKAMRAELKRLAQSHGLPDVLPLRSIG